MKIRANPMDITIQDQISNRQWFIVQAKDQTIEIVDSQNVFVALITGEVSTPDDLPRARLMAAAPRMASEIVFARILVGALRYWLPPDLLYEVNTLLGHMGNTLQQPTGECKPEGDAQTEMVARREIHNACLQRAEVVLADESARLAHSMKARAAQEKAQEGTPTSDVQTKREDGHDLCT